MMPADIKPSNQGISTRRGVSTAPAGYPSLQQRCVVRTCEGISLTTGLMLLSLDGEGLHACVTGPDAPGALLSACIGRGITDFTIAFEDGRTVGARLDRLSWQGPSGRIFCFLLDPVPPVDGD